MKTPLSILPYWQEKLRELLFPQGCVLCGKPLFKDACYGLCKNCREDMAIPQAVRGRCSMCGQPLISEQNTCLPCRNGPERSFDRLLSLYPYLGKYKKVLAEYKFNRRLSLAGFFAEKILENLYLLLENEDPGKICLVPVPPRAGKIKHGGWDQIDYLAKKILSVWAVNSSILMPKQKFFNNQSLSVRGYLKRLPSVSQKELNKENRLQNLKGKIIVSSNYLMDKKKGLSPKTIIVFDDVYTTGATVDACAAALKSAGTERVLGICLCYD